MFKLLVIVVLLSVSSFSFANIKGHKLAEIQFNQGLTKKLYKSRNRDQSFEGLKDIINQSQDQKLKEMIPIVNKLENIVKNQIKNNEFLYKDNFLSYFEEICTDIDREYGIPAPVLMAQLIGESGWGGSNITILKNNVLGMGNKPKKSKGSTNTILLDFKEEIIEIDVKFLKDTTAMSFNSVEDCVYSYVHHILLNEKTEIFYSSLRKYIKENKDNRPQNYQDKYIHLMSSSYHSNPSWYINYIKAIIEQNDLNAFIGGNTSKNSIYKLAQNQKTLVNPIVKETKNIGSIGTLDVGAGAWIKYFETEPGSEGKPNTKVKAVSGKINVYEIFDWAEKDESLKGETNHKWYKVDRDKQHWIFGLEQFKFEKN